MIDPGQPVCAASKADCVQLPYLSLFEAPNWLVIDSRKANPLDEMKGKLTVSARSCTLAFLLLRRFLTAFTTSLACPGSPLMTSQMSRFMAQSGPINKSLVALSTRLAADAILSGSLTGFAKIGRILASFTRFYRTEIIRIKNMSSTSPNRSTQAQQRRENLTPLSSFLLPRYLK
jgi:hypothetical protein